LSRDEGEATGFTIVEKFFALLIILIGALVVYTTATSPAVVFSFFFAVGGLALIVLGVFMVLAKTR
jgi:hypothetical protein